MSYTGEDVRKLTEQYRAEMRKCDEARYQMMREFIQRIRKQEEEDDAPRS